jgi:hypothetical protein
MDIKNKQIMYDNLKRGVFGNVIQTWNNLEDMYNSEYNGRVGIRYRKPGGLCIPETDIENIIEFMMDKSWSDYVIYESPPNNVGTIQGEVSVVYGEWYLTYSMSHRPMREALEIDTRHAAGLAAKLILKDYLWSASYDEIEFLLNEYDYHTVEFSAYSVALGIFKGRNAIIWEVRSY